MLCCLYYKLYKCKIVFFLVNDNIISMSDDLLGLLSRVPRAVYLFLATATNSSLVAGVIPIVGAAAKVAR